MTLATFPALSLPRGGDGEGRTVPVPISQEGGRVETALKRMRRVEGALAREDNPRRALRLGRLWMKLLARIKRRVA